MSERNISTQKVVKSSIWYTISNFIVKGLAFLTLPIFARLMTKAEMGDYSNFLVWMSLIDIVFGFSLDASINRARLDFPGELDRYCSSILILGSGLAVFGFLLLNLLWGQVGGIINFPQYYLFFIFSYLIFQHAYSITLAKQRIFYRYKKSVMLSLGLAVISTSFSVVLVLSMQNRFLGRSIGHVVPMILMGLPLYIVLVRRGKTVRWKYIRYALAFCWPFVPHLLSMKVLSASDRVMITNMIGREANATYTIANNCVSIATLFFTSLNTAISPWVYDQLESKDTRELKRITVPYVLIFVMAVQIIQLAAPEVLMIVGGKKYLDAKDCFLPLFTSVTVQFCYAMYVNIEQYSRKTWAIAGGTLIAAAVNVVLNFLLIPRFGYVAAAYTTLIGYLVLFAVHFIFVRLIGYKRIYNDRFIFIAIFASLLMQPVISILYRHTVARYAVFALYLFVGCYLLYKNRDRFMMILKKKKTTKGVE